MADIKKKIELLNCLTDRYNIRKISMDILNIPIDIINAIVNDNTLTCRDKIYFISSCNLFFKNIYIDSLSQNKNINDNILLQPKFYRITCLRMPCNTNISEISHLTSLTLLDISSDINLIGQNSINMLHNLRHFDIFNNQNITNIAHLTNLTFLNVGRSQIKQNSIDVLLKLQTLRINANKYITNIAHLTKLTALSISYTNINQASIDNLYSLTWLYSVGNRGISTSHLTNLEVLNGVKIKKL